MAASGGGAVTLDRDDTGNGTRTPMVFVHGMTCDRTFFAPQVEHFAPGRRCLSVDLRGHGKSPVTDDGYTIESFAADVAATVDSAGIDRLVAIGHSMGGLTVLQLAADRPDLVAAAVLVDPSSLKWDDAGRAWIDGVIADIRHDRNQGLEARRQMVMGMFMRTDDDATKQHVVDVMLATDPSVAASCLEAVRDADGETALARCGEAGTPVAFIGSAAPSYDERRIRELHRRAHVGQTLGAGHFNQLEVPDQVNAMIERFLLVSGID